MSIQFSAEVRWRNTSTRKREEPLRAEGRIHSLLLFTNTLPHLEHRERPPAPVLRSFSSLSQVAFISSASQGTNSEKDYPAGTPAVSLLPECQVRYGPNGRCSWPDHIDRRGHPFRFPPKEFPRMRLLAHPPSICPPTEGLARGPPHARPPPSATPPMLRLPIGMAMAWKYWVSF